MCYPKPGPRCAGHLSSQMSKVSAQLDANMEAFTTGEPAPHPGVTRTSLLFLQEEYDGTMTGQRALDAEIEEATDPAYRAALQARQAHTADLYMQKKAELDSEAGQWGVVNVSEGSRTPWGSAQSVESPAAGIVAVSTVGHGGIKLSPQRNAEIPPALRQSSGWYEEDCDASIVGMYHPEAFPHYQNGDYDKIREACEATVKSQYPDEFEQATGRTVDVSESMALQDREAAADKDAFRAAHAGEFVSLGHGDTNVQQKWIPKGYAVTKARMDATGEERQFLVPYDQVITDKSWGKQVLVDPDRALDVTDVMNAGKAPQTEAQTRAPIQGEALTVDYSGMASRNADAASKELDTRYRWSNGSVGSFRERLAEVGVQSKSQTSSGYHVRTAAGESYTVKKSTFQALSSVPDDTSELDRARVASSRAVEAMDKIPSWDRAKKARAESRYLAAAATAKAAEDADKAANPLRYYEGIQSARSSAFASLLADKGLSFDD